MRIETVSPDDPSLPEYILRQYEDYSASEDVVIIKVSGDLDGKVQNIYAVAEDKPHIFGAALGGLNHAICRTWKYGKYAEK